MIFKLYRLICDNCGREYKEYFDEKDDALIYPHKNGWIRKKVENGSEWDSCPDCIKKIINNK